MKNLILLAALVPAFAAAAQPRKTITLTAPTLVGGVLLAAGEAQVFEPGEELAHGVLAADSQLENLTLPQGTELEMESPGRIATASLPNQSNAVMVADLPFAGRAVLRFGYGEYLARFRGAIAYHPTQYPSFPKVNLEPAAFENEVSADCSIGLSHLGKPEGKFYCQFSLALREPLQHKFGALSVTIPAETLITFNKYGLETVRLARDQDFMGLPVSASENIRLGTYEKGGTENIIALSLSHDAIYRGIGISARSAVGFYDAIDEAGPRLESFTPSDQLSVRAGDSTLMLAPLESVHLNKDGSLHYGALAFPQSIRGALFPAEAEVFFGDHAGTMIESVGLPPFATVTIDGVTYGD
ncbi:MAG: hypothetical protein ACXWR1_07690, partial [Bdellovibrionota bacterium]